MTLFYRALYQHHPLPLKRFLFGICAMMGCVFVCIFLFFKYKRAVDTNEPVTHYEEDSVEQAAKENESSSDSMLDTPSIAAEMENVNKTEKEEVTKEQGIFEAYRDYFYENFDTDNENFYVYFADIQHTGMDNMIVMQWIPFKAYIGCSGYLCSIFANTDDGITKVYENSINYSEDDELHRDGLLFDDSLYLIRKDQECFLCKGKTLLTGDYGSRIQKQPYDVFYIYENGSEIIVDTVEAGQFKFGSFGYDLLPSYLQKSFCLSDNNYSLFDDVGGGYGGINMSFNHDSHRVFSEKDYSRINTFEEKALEVAENSEEPLTDILFYDFNKDDDEECVCVFYCGSFDGEYPDKGVYYAKYLDENSEEIIWRQKYGVIPAYINGIQFGDVVQVAIGDQESEDPDYEVYDFTDGVTDIGDNWELGFIQSDRVSGRPFISVAGEEGNNGPGADVLGPHKIYLFIQDDNYCEYDSIKIAEDDLKVFNNYKDEMKKAENDIENAKDTFNETFSNLQIYNILYSSDDHIYINYQLEYVDRFDGNQKNWWRCAEFEIINEELKYKEFTESIRPLSSEGDGLASKDIVHYTVPFPYK